MDDNEIRDMMGRSLEFGRKFGIAWDLLVEINRIVAAATARNQIGKGEHVPRSALAIAVSPSLRSSGVAIMSLPRPLRTKAAELISIVDEYNSKIETVDPGHREEARLTDQLREMLGKMIKDGGQICEGLNDVLKEQP
jgi:hypothetical protein